MNGDDLIGFVSRVSGEDHLKIEENLGAGYVRLRVSEAQRRQAKHDIRAVEDIVIEMLRNARDAGATKIFLATTKEENSRHITIIDDGNGIPVGMQNQIFEPRVTSKLESMIVDQWGVHGRGMALYSIRENARVAKVVTSRENLGSSFYVNIDLEAVTEKADQSSWPSLEKDEVGVPFIARGPHNILRNTLEFALEYRDIDVYLGSPTEVAGTLYQIGHRDLDDQVLLFCDDIETLPVYVRPATCSDASDLTDICDSLGLPISERGAHRILAGDIRPLRPAISKLLSRPSSSGPEEVDILKDRRGLKIASDDIESFSRSMENAFEYLAGKYYLSLRDIPHVTVSKDCIRVRFDIDKDI